MKKITWLFAFVLISFVGKAQENKTEETEMNVDQGLTVSAQAFVASQISGGGISFEGLYRIKHGLLMSSVANISYGVMDVQEGELEITGSGGMVELGSRTYYNKDHENRGLYSINYLSYGRIEFDEDLPFGQEFEGTYQYFSFANLELGYRIQLGDFAIDPFVGGMWKIEIKGEGDFDNHFVDEWDFRGGLRVGYQF